jgi:hypothetical protein
MTPALGQHQFAPPTGKRLLNQRTHARGAAMIGGRI